VFAGVHTPTPSLLGARSLTASATGAHLGHLVRFGQSDERAECCRHPTGSGRRPRIQLGTS